jgi:hypothetical protein
MQAVEVLTELNRMGLRLSPLPGGKIEAAPKQSITEEARRLIRSHKRELLVALAEEARIRTWLRSIGEECPQVVGEILERARTDPKARADYLRRAEEIGTWGAAAFYEGVLGNAAMSVATLEPGQRSEAVRIGLLPQPIAESDAVVLAYRNNGVQGLMTVPADRYDGLRVLELLALNPVS